MSNLNSLNIRKGLELEVDVVDIFAVNTSESGDKLTKEIYDIGWKEYSIINAESWKKIIQSGGTIYNSEKETIKLSDTLIAYVFDSYLIDISFPDELNTPNVYIDKSKEIEFLNTEILDFDQFCINIMQAQSFTGKYKHSDFKFSFYGYGNFSMLEYVDIHKIVTMSNLHTLSFFLKYKNVISGISCFLNGLHRNDIVRQREYLTSKEFATLLNEADMQFEAFSSIMTNSYKQ